MTGSQLPTEQPLYFENFNLTDVVTPVNAQVLGKLLNQVSYDVNKVKFLVKGFTKGFSISYKGPKDIQRYAPNLKIRIGDATILWNKVMREVRDKHLAGPYLNPPFKNFIQSPIGFIPKGKDGTQCRLIFHLSYPKDGDLVNSFTPCDRCTVKYPDFSDAVRLCLKAGKSCKIAKSDMKVAFRNLGIKPKHFAWLLLKAKSPFDGLTYFFVDKCLPFGSSISCALFQAFSDAIAAMVSYRTKQDLVNYLDDYFFVALLKLMCNGQVDEFLLVCKMVNFPVSLDKTFQATTRLTFLGMLLDTELQVVCIPQDKVVRAQVLLDYLLNKKSKKMTVKMLQKLCGFLNFLCRGIVPGRAFTRRLYGALEGKSHLKMHHHFRINSEMRMDMQVWRTFLDSPTCFCRPFLDFDKTWLPEELVFYTDASRNFQLGMGGYWNQSWFCQPWNIAFMRKYQPSIQFLELYAVTAGLLIWMKNFQNKRIVVYCDNQSVMNMLNHGSSNCKYCMVLIRLVILESLIWNVSVYAQHVKSKDNGIADALSHLDWPRFYKLTENMDMDDISTLVPPQIWPMEKIWLNS